MSQVRTNKRVVEVTLPRITLRNEARIREWYDKLQAIAREHVMYSDLLARLLVEARKRDYDLSHLINSNGTLTAYAEHMSPEELRDMLLDSIADNVDLIKMMINVPSYPRTKQAFELAIKFLKEMCGVEFDDDEIMDIAFDEVAVVIEEFFRAMR